MPLEESFDPNAPQPQPLNESQPRASEPPLRSSEPSTRGPNNLPEAHDKTTEQIRSLSNFNLSDALGLPLLTKDVKTDDGKTASPPHSRDVGAVSRDAGGNWAPGVFGMFSSRDRLVLCASAIMVLGPLFFGMMRG